MAMFRYRALSSVGELVSGEMEAQDGAAVIAKLHESALLPIEATEGAQTGRTILANGQRVRTLPARELGAIGQQLARLLRAGAPLDRALSLLISGGKRGRATIALEQTLESLIGGASLADAMRGANGAFPELFVSMIRAGEDGGALHAVLDRTSDFLTRSEAMRQKVISALIYPAILLAASTGAVVLVLTVVLPQFEPLFADAGASLPASTRFVMGTSDLLRADGWLVVPTMLALWVLSRAVMRSPAAAASRDRTLLRIPLLGTLVLKIEIARFARMLGTLLGNGVAAPRALGLCAEVIRNRRVQDAVMEVAERFREGEGLAAPLARTGVFPDLSTQLVRIGEETGRLDELLQEVASIYEQDVQRTLERLLALLVPALTVIMGLVIAGVVVSILVAMIAINNLAG